MDLGWRFAHLDATLSWQHIAHMEEQLSGRPIPSVDYFHLTGTLDGTDSLQLYLGINNLLDEDAPIFPNQIQNTDVSTYDAVGRFYFLGANLKF